MVSPLLILGLCLGALGATARLAEAKPRLALAEIAGDDDGDMVDAVGEALDGDELSVIYPNAVARVADKLGYEQETLTEKQAKKVAAALEADALAVARLERDGKHKVLRFRLYIGGKKARGFRVTFNNAQSARFQTMLRAKLVQRIAEADDDAGGAAPAVAAAADAGEDDDAGEGAADASAVTVRQVRPRAANRVAVRIDLGISAQNRTLSFTQRSDFPEGPRPFKNAPVPGARFEAELYPFAFGDPYGVAAGLGLAAEYDKTLINNLNTSAEPTVVVPANQQHWSVGARYRIPFGRTPASPTLTLGVGVGRRSFVADRSGLVMASSLDLPDTRYTLLDPGLAVRVPVTGVLALTFGGKALVVFDAGPIQEPESYGRAKVFGAQGQAGIDVVLGGRFAVRLVGELVQIGFAFTGNGAMSNARDQDPTTKDIGGAADRSIGGAATLAVRY